MLLFFYACTSETPSDTGDSTAPVDTAADTADSADTGDSADTADTGPLPIFEEPFDTLDQTRWLPGDWVLGATQLDPRNAHIVEGGVILVHKADGAGGWSGVELYTDETFSGGMWSALMVPPEAPGSVCAFFFYGESAGISNEIDVELVGSSVWFSVYRDWSEADGYDDGPAHVHAVWPYPEGFDISSPHEFRMAWAADSVTFFVDDVEAASLPMVPSTPIGVHLNHWTSTTWTDVAYPPPDKLICRVEGILAFALPE